MILLSQAMMVILCAAAFSAWNSARSVGINGWLTRYTLALMAHSGAATLVLIVAGERSPLYFWTYVALLVPILAAIIVQGIAWLWQTQAFDRAIIGTGCFVLSFYGVFFMHLRAEAQWPSGIPAGAWLLIIQFPILSSAGVMALGSEARLNPEMQPVAHLLGTMWFMQGLEKALSASGFMYMFDLWLPVNRVLPTAIVAVFLYALSRRFRLIQHDRVLLRQAAQNSEAT